ncbi:type I DNA topoisomerase [Candidatus Uhrbacteria bacterium]|jgi:DNA topoisomerase I|nr:type I DNA topoisomerase [Candidatus Uhrbacteria bacterium]MBT7716780.1 type I DNA topoisomerase [Candidatus Uhrbacteria bacterium]
MGTKLLIVESPTKARTITKFLGAPYEVLSSYGHIRDLPRKEMGVDTEKNFTPKYVVPTDKKKRVSELKAAAKKADEIYLASDEDREGEAIAWHIAEILGLKENEIKRIAFHEITKHAIEEALKEPRKLSMDLVDAQQTRRILDRLVGYELSPFLWKKVQRGLSAGRVQSVALRLIVERERERNAFNTDEYWTIEGLFEKDATEFEGKLSKIDGKTVKKLQIQTEADAQKIKDDVAGVEFTVSSMEKKHATRKPPVPLTTSSLQQEANSKLGFGAKQTMTIAQKLYETGMITYMRTDSLNLADKFLGEAQAYIQSSLGSDYATGQQVYKTKKKGAQEAHEAIRPTDVTASPEDLRQKLSDEGQWKLYDLIWRRTLATQLPPAKLEQTGINLEAKNYTFRASGSIIVFDGFMKVYRAAKQTILPEVKEGDKVLDKGVDAKQHFTEPPARFSDATLVKVMEEHGIGRPSTYAPTIGTIIDRGYVERDERKKLAPTNTALIVTDLLVEHFPDIVDYEFTATMEKTLDEIAEGKIEWEPMLEAFYRPFHKNLEEKADALTRADVMHERELGVDKKSGKMVYLKTGRFGPFVQLGEYHKEDKEAPKPKSSSLLKGMNMDTVKLEEVMPLFDLPRTVGETEGGEKITSQLGPYGPYLKAGKLNASLPEDISVLEVDEATARVIIETTRAEKKAMAEPLAKLGEDPESKGEILVKVGRFGPYISDGTTNVSIPKKFEPTEVSREQAIEMLIKKRAKKGYKKTPAKKKPAKKTKKK